MESWSARPYKVKGGVKHDTEEHHRNKHECKSHPGVCFKRKGKYSIHTESAREQEMVKGNVELLFTDSEESERVCCRLA